MKRQQFRDRREAGQLLANQLIAYHSHPEVLILALPRGGVPVAYEIAKVLEVQLDVLIVRKLGVPGSEELAFGAIASGGVFVLNEDVVQMFALSPKVITAVADEARQEVIRREHLYRGNRLPFDVSARTIILVDDGMATGASMRAAVKAIKKQQAARIIVAIPVAALETCEILEAEVDELICLMKPAIFDAVGFWYEEFTQTTDEEVHDLLAEAARNQA